MCWAGRGQASRELSQGIQWVAHCRPGSGTTASPHQVGRHRRRGASVCSTSTPCRRLLISAVPVVVGNLPHGGGKGQIATIICGEARGLTSTRLADWLAG